MVVAMTKRTAMSPRRTKQRAELEQFLATNDEFRTAQQIHEALRASGSETGLATIYRNLQQLADVGEVDTLRNDTGETLYRRCEVETHHHHLVCRSCGRTEDITGPSIEQWAEEKARERGYTNLAHTLELFGDCSDCATAANVG